ncbi:cytochrome P450 [Calocera cornea HHB12733]|uniref:Cytochrome P450 n=1 Tax=Calocera cornea HHB12733 TaxID=1353952 RepID=A0A165GTL9_9BASI|nr:cytochrome P450 [Calocera cornea HHB12733]
MRACMPQKSIVDTLPFLAPLSKRVKWFRKQSDDWFEETDEEGKRLYSGGAPGERWETLVQDLDINREKYGLSSHDAVWTTLSLFMAAQETTSTALRVFTLAMLNNPAVMKAAQRQLDSICGDRPPTFADKDKLPYIEAIIKETLRWKPGVPLSRLNRVSEVRPC